MAEDRPTATELIETVREFLQEKLLPTMSGHTAFEVRIAANLLSIALREHEQAPRAVEAERERLAELLGQEGTLAHLETELVRRIRAGELSPDDGVLRAHLRLTIGDRLAIANPKYLGSI